MFAHAALQSRLETGFPGCCIDQFVSRYIPSRIIIPTSIVHTAAPRRPHAPVSLRREENTDREQGDGRVTGRRRCSSTLARFARARSRGVETRRPVRKAIAASVGYRGR